jgi:hypothetical protein
MNNSYLEGFNDGIHYIEEKYYSHNSDDSHDNLTPLVIGGGVGALGGNIYGGFRSRDEIKEHKKLAEELERSKETLSTLKNDLSKVDRLKSLKAGFKDVLDVFAGKPNAKELSEDIEQNRSEVSRLKDMISKKKSEIEQLEKKIKPIRDSVLKSKGISTGVGLGIGLTSAGLYNILKNKDNK